VCLHVLSPESIFVLNLLDILPKFWKNDPTTVEHRLMFNPLKGTVGASFILVGDETLEKKLSLQIMASVRTRLTGQFSLNALNDNESIEFIKFRLSNAGAPENLFDSDALSIMSSHCRGNRRQIMNMGTILLTEAFYRQEKTISAELIYNCDQIEISE